MPRVPIALACLAATVVASGQQVFLPCMPYGGQQAVDRLLRQELRYPDECGAKGNVLLFLGILADGSVAELRVWRPLHPACDAEALRVARMIRWHPALMAGDAVGAEHFLAIPFDRRRIERWSHERRPLDHAVLQLPADTTLQLYAAEAVQHPAYPDIPQGWSGLEQHLRNGLIYPPDAIRRDIEGVVLAEFVVEPSGTLSNMRAVQELGAGCNEEAFRLLSAIDWVPAVHQGQRVRTPVRVKLRFRLPR